MHQSQPTIMLNMVMHNLLISSPDEDSSDYIVRQITFYYSTLLGDSRKYPFRPRVASTFYPHPTLAFRIKMLYPSKCISHDYLTFSGFMTLYNSVSLDSSNEQELNMFLEIRLN